MNTLILRETTSVLVALILMFSVFMLLRGHDHPGGGFIGGLIASIAFSLYLFASDAPSVRKLLRVPPTAISTAGLALVLVSGLAGPIVDQTPFLSSKWLQIGSLHAGTPLLFDIGVYLAVIGAMMTFILGIMEN